MMGHTCGQSRGARTLLALLGVLALAVGFAAAPAIAAAAKKKKGASKAKIFTQQLQVNGAIPDAPATGVSTPLTSTITVPKKFKGKMVGDVNLTALQTTGSAAGAADDLTAYLTGPSGRTLQLFLGVGDQSLGPWTLDDDTKASICNVAAGTVCADPSQSLYRPFAGTSNVLSNWNGGFPTNGTLTDFNGAGMTGTWTLTVVDVQPGGANGTSVLNQWGLQIRRLKPVKP